MECARFYALFYVWLPEVIFALSGTTDTFVMYGSPLDTNLNDSLNTTVPATSVTQCAKACSNIGCHSFVFTDEDQCRLYNKHEEPSVVPNRSKDFQFFVRQDSSEQLCYRGDSSEYTGSVNTTLSGLKCQRWDSQSPHGHTRTDAGKYPETSLSLAQNYCRDPDDGGSPWCYTVDPSVRFQYCLFKCIE